MKNIISSLRLTLIFCVFFGIFYVGVLWIFARIAAPGHGNASVVTSQNRIVGVENVGQRFSDDIYFWGRPSCAGNGHDAANSGGSNKGATNPEYIEEVKIRIEAFLHAHPYLQKEEVPAEMVTASGSGLDPHITPACAFAQIQRVAAARGISKEAVRVIVDSQIEKPLLGLFGPEKINVLKLNIALQEATLKK
ncbi:MAG: K(+)-transporting ATPase subunit C [Bacteroidales bacterium]